MTPCEAKPVKVDIIDCSRLRFHISCLCAVPSDEFGLQVRLPQTFVFNHMPDCRFHRDAGVTHLRRSHETFSWKEGLVAIPGSLL